MADDKKDKQESKNPFKKINDGFGKFGNLFKKKEDDPVFLGHKENFKKQRAIALQYSTVFQKYEDCLKDLVECQEKLHNIIEQTYEIDWVAQYELKEFLHGASAEWTGYLSVFAKLLEDQKTYLSRFDELKKKISHRRKKRDEYEQAKKDLEAKQQAKKPDSAKIALAEIDYKARKAEFEKVDAELLAELPEFYASRSVFYQKNVGTLAKTDKQLYSELVEYLKKAVAKFEGAEDTKPSNKAARLPSDTNNPFAESAAPSSTPVSIYPQVPKTESARDSPTPRHRLTIPAPNSTTTASEHRKNAAPVPQISPAVNSATTCTTTPAPPAKPPRISRIELAEDVPVHDSPGNPFLAEESETTESSEQTDAGKGEKSRSSSNSTDGKRESSEAAVAPERSPKAAHSQDGKSPESKEPSKEVAIRKVRATHKYAAVEEDELAFDKGDIIEVLPWLSDEDAEDGWLRGRRESDGKYGVFPENHTKPV